MCQLRSRVRWRSRPPRVHRQTLRRPLWINPWGAKTWGTEIWDAKTRPWWEGPDAKRARLGGHFWMEKQGGVKNMLSFDLPTLWGNEAFVFFTPIHRFPHSESTQFLLRTRQRAPQCLTISWERRNSGHLNPTSHFRNVASNSEQNRTALCRLSQVRALHTDLPLKNHFFRNWRGHPCKASPWKKGGWNVQTWASLVLLFVYGMIPNQLMECMRSRGLPGIWLRPSSNMSLLCLGPQDSKENTHAHCARAPPLCSSSWRFWRSASHPQPCALCIAKVSATLHSLPLQQRCVGKEKPQGGLSMPCLCSLFLTTNKQRLNIAATSQHMLPIWGLPFAGLWAVTESCMHTAWTTSPLHCENWGARPTASCDHVNRHLLDRPWTQLGSSKAFAGPNTSLIAPPFEIGMCSSELSVSSSAHKRFMAMKRKFQVNVRLSWSAYNEGHEAEMDAGIVGCKAGWRCGIYWLCSQAD